MKVVLLNKSDSKGGAARAARRLFRGLRELGVEARFVVKDKRSEDPDVRAAPAPSPAFLTRERAFRAL